ncbi:MAG TPA: DUF309 domain-containing protein [Verrucomicrobiae bacterium]|nr:DUF309 domain-containing protein [Verrucomicrobiae bacterium]
MVRKSERIRAEVQKFHGGRWDPHYAGYFDQFNRQLFYEAHDVLEQLWLADRHGPDGAFYKGLIQLAGAFVHLQKNRPGPSAALFKLARANLERYPSRHRGLDLSALLQMIESWIASIEATSPPGNPLPLRPPPKLALSAE